MQFIIKIIVYILYLSLYYHTLLNALKFNTHGCLL